jgi:HEAT repeat protein
VKDWKIHLSWALAVPLIAFLWGRWIEARGEQERLTRGTIFDGNRRHPGQPSISPSHRSPESPLSPEPQDVIAEVRRLLLSEKEEDRSRGEFLLRRVPDGPEKKELILLALASPDPELRSSALNDLVRLFGPDAVPYVQAMLKSDSEAYLRRIAAELLGSLGGTGTMEALLGAVHDPERYVQVTAAGALNRLGQPGPAEDLVLRVTADLSSPDSAIRGEAVKDLTLLKLPSTIPILLRSLRDSDSFVRGRAAAGLAELDSPDLAASLEALSKDPNPDVAYSAKVALIRYRRSKQQGASK